MKGLIGMISHGENGGPDHDIGNSAETGSANMNQVMASEGPPRRCHIYAIEHLASGRKYIGSSVNHLDRWRRHKYNLRHNKHHCTYLQRAWNKYKEDAFSFSVIETIEDCIHQQRREAELKWIKQIGKTYNSLTHGEGLEHFYATPESRELRRIAAKKRMSDPEKAAWYKNRGNELAAEMRSPEGRKRAGEITKRRWQDKKERKKLYQGLINRWNQPNARETQSEKLKAAKGTPEARQKNSESAKARWANPNSKMHTRKQTRWADPKARRAQSDKMTAYHASKRKD